MANHVVVEFIHVNALKPMHDIQIDAFGAQQSAANKLYELK